MDQNLQVDATQRYQYYLSEKAVNKIEGISVDMPRRPCVETSENGEISLHTHMGKHESTSDELLLLPTNDDSYQTAINRLPLIIRNTILDKLRQCNVENGLKHVNKLPYCLCYS